MCAVPWRETRRPVDLTLLGIQTVALQREREPDSPLVRVRYVRINCSRRRLLRS